MYLIFIFLLSLTISIKPQEIREIIQPIKIVAGSETIFLLSDLFYSSNYDVKFIPNTDLEVKYDNATNTVSVQSSSNFSGSAFIHFIYNEKDFVIPIISSAKKKILFTLDPKLAPYKKINLFGSFNGWDRQNLPMIQNENGFLSASVELEPGKYEYKYFAEGVEFLDPANSDSIPNGLGGYNSILIVEDSKSNAHYLHIDKLVKEQDKYYFNYYYEKSDAQENLTIDNVKAILDNSLINKDRISITGNALSIQLYGEELKGKRTLRVFIENKGNVSNIQHTYINNGQIAGSDGIFNWNDAIMYSIMIDRFNDGDKTINNPLKHDSLFWQANYQGGDLQGIINKIEDGYFTSLGINTLWISPVYDNPNIAYREYPKPNRWYSGYHGYWPISSTRVEEQFGTIELLKELVQKAHARGIKVLLDFVSNHVHAEHPLWKEHRDWFGQLELPDGRLNIRFWDEYRLTTWFEPFMPSFDFEGSNEAVEYLTDNAVWWIKETGVDGYRHDAVKHVPNVFWRALTAKLKKEIEIPNNIKMYQIGETFGSYDLISSYINNGQLDAQFNFNLYDVAVPTFSDVKGSFINLDREIKKGLSVYGTNHLMGNIIDSHDKPRFMSYADGDLTMEVSFNEGIEIGWNNPPEVDNPENYKKHKLYFTYLLTTPGIPTIYYGAEIGITGAGDPDNRRFMRFDDQLNEYEKDNLEDISKMVFIRKNNSSLRYGDFYTLYVDDDVYAYLRSDFNQSTITVINKSMEMKSLKLKLPDHLNGLKWYDAYDGRENEQIGNSLTLVASPQSGFVVVNRK